MDSVGNDRITHLDGLRGFCALIVVLHHFMAAFYPMMIFGNLAKSHFSYEWIFYATPLNLFFGGNFGVTIFFVLSGYVLSFAFFNNKKIKPLQSLALRRYPRLMIPVFGSVIIGFFLLHFNLLFHQLIIAETYSFLWLGKVFAGPAFFFEALYQGIIGAFIDPHQWKYNHVIWSMYYEFWGSFLVFGFLALFGSIKKRYLVYGFLFIIFWKSYFLGFILGLLSADVFTHLDKRKLKVPSYYLWFGFFIGGIFGSYPMFTVTETYYQFLNLSFLTESENMIFYHTLGAFLIVNSVLYLKPLHNFFSFKFFRFLGKISFSLYLLHTFVIFSFSALLFYICLMYFSYHLSFIFTFIISLILIILLSHLYYELIDRPSMRLSRTISRRLLKK